MRQKVNVLCLFDDYGYRLTCSYYTYVRTLCLGTLCLGKQNGRAGLTGSYCIHCYHCNIVLHIIVNIFLKSSVQACLFPWGWDGHILRKLSISARN